MLDPGRNFRFGGRVRTQLVRHDDLQLAPSLEQLSEKAFGGGLTPTGLNQNIKYTAVGIDSTPEPDLACLDRNHDFVEVPFISRARPISPDFLCKLDAKIQNPVADCLIGNDDPARR